MVKTRKNYIGEVFGRLTVVKQVDDYVSPKSGQHFARFACRCSCGNTELVEVNLHALRNKNEPTLSCGCLAREESSKRLKERNPKPMSKNPSLRLNLIDNKDGKEYGECRTYNTNELYYFSMDFYDILKDTNPCAYTDHTGKSRLVVYDKNVKNNKQILSYLGISGWDHKDRNNTMDYRWSNLRPATRSEQNQNRGMQKNNTSGFKGICWNKRSEKWQAYIYIDGEQIYLGLFENKEDAVKARLEAEKKYGSDGFQPNRDKFEL